MDLVSLSPLRATLLAWQPRPRVSATTLVCKATFELAPGALELAEQQEPLLDEDRFADGDPQRSLVAQSDRVPFKPRADVVFVGHAHAPNGEPVRSVVARLSIGSVDKSIEVTCDRVITPEGSILEGPWFTAMPLAWERAAGGPSTTNPIGVRPDALAEGGYGRQLPNLRLPGAIDPIQPIGLGAIAPTWPERYARLSRHAAVVLDPGWAERPLPEDLDVGFFNAAPYDQQPEWLAPGQRLVLENLHADHPRLVMDLPAIRPRAFMEAQGALEEIGLACDTLWIDGDRGLLTLTFRGQVPTRAGTERVHVLLEEPGRPLSWTDIRRRCGGLPSMAFAGDIPLPTGELSDSTARFDLSAVRVERPVDASPAWLRRMGAAAAARPAELVSPQALLGKETIVVPSQTAAAPARPPLWAPPLPPKPDLGAPPPLEPPPRPSFASIAGLSSLSVEPPPMRSSFASGADAPLAIPMGSNGGGDVKGGILSLSNAAASANRLDPAAVEAPARDEPAPKAEPAAPPAPAMIFDLLWFDAAALPRMRETTRWIERIAGFRPTPWRAANDPAEAEIIEDPPDVQDRRDVLAVISGGAPTPLADLDDAMAAAAESRQGFSPPLVAIAGELAPAFDELETLKATLSAASPFTAGDKKLKEVSDLINELLKTPWLEGATEVSENLTTRLRDAFAQGSRSLPPGYLDTHVERTLLKQRRYQKVTVFGATWIRALLTEPGGAPPIPTYLPEAVSGKLPMFRRFPVRIVAEVHLQQDQYESHPHALRAVALAREAPTSRARK